MLFLTLFFALGELGVPVLLQARYQFVDDTFPTIKIKLIELIIQKVIVQNAKISPGLSSYRHNNRAENLRPIVCSLRSTSAMRSVYYSKLQLGWAQRDNRIDPSKIHSYGIRVIFFSFCMYILTFLYHIIYVRHNRFVPLLD